MVSQLFPLLQLKHDKRWKEAESDAGPETKPIVIGGLSLDIKMIVTDLDGTLLRNDKMISPYTVEVLEKCRTNGIKVVFATARSERNIVDFSKVIAPDAIISNNGAQISCNNTVIQCNYMLPANVQSIVSQLLTIPGIQLTLDYASMSVTNCKEYMSWGDCDVNYSDFSEYDPHYIQKIVIAKANKSITKHIDFRRYNCHVYYCPDTKWYMVMANMAKKSDSVRYLAEYFGISLAQVIAFGDDHNDIEMLQECGIGVAVANAIDEAKFVANHTCDTNENDGVAKWIMSNIIEFTRDDTEQENGL